MCSLAHACEWMCEYVYADAWFYLECVNGESRPKLGNRVPRLVRICTQATHYELSLSFSSFSNRRVCSLSSCTLYLRASNDIKLLINRHHFKNIFIGHFTTRQRKKFIGFTLTRCVCPGNPCTQSHFMRLALSVIMLQYQFTYAK